MNWRHVVVGSALAGLLGAAAPVSAAQITGSFAISGGVTYDTLDTTGGAGLFFDQTVVVTPPTQPTGGFTEVTVATGYFSTQLGMGPLIVDGGGTQGTVGRILHITNVTPPTSVNYTYAPAGVDLTGTVNNFLQSFVTFTNSVGAPSDLHFDLTNIPLAPGVGCPASPSCVEGPFTIVSTALGVRIEFDVIGYFRANGDADEGLYTGSFGITINGLNINQLGERLATGQDIACGTGNITQPCSWTANFNPFVETVVPEPATMALFGLGSVVLAAQRRRAMKKGKK